MLIEPKFGCQLFFFFFKNLALSKTRYHGQPSSCAISKKTNDSILRKFSNGQMDGQSQMNRQLDQSDFIGHCLTNVKQPKSNNLLKGSGKCKRSEKAA